MGILLKGVYPWGYTKGMPFLENGMLTAWRVRCRSCCGDGSAAAGGGAGEVDAATAAQVASRR